LLLFAPRENSNFCESASASISVAAAPGCRHSQPHFIRRAHPIRDLQQQIEGEAELHLHDR
jgi:hypothetical protein